MTFVSKKFVRLTIEEFNASAINSTTENRSIKTVTITINSHDTTEFIVTKVYILCIKEHVVEVAIISFPSLLNLQLTLCVLCLYVWFTCMFGSGEEHLFHFKSKENKQIYYHSHWQHFANCSLFVRRIVCDDDLVNACACMWITIEEIL